MKVIRREAWDEKAKYLTQWVFDFSDENRLVREQHLISPPFQKDIDTARKHLTRHGDVRHYTKNQIEMLYEVFKEANNE